MPSDHNSADYLTVMYRWRAPPTGGRYPPGWYVVRSCECHYNHPVTVPFSSRERAERVRNLLLKASEVCGT